MKETDLRFALFPAGGEETASSRIRVYTFQRELEKQGIAATLGYSAGANVFYVQKKVTRKTLWQSRLAKMIGAIVIYDVDDLGPALWYWIPRPYFEQMLRLADLVTTCSEEQKRLLISQYKVGRCEVVLPAIDYYPTGTVRTSLINRVPLRVAWFGSGSTFHLFEHYLPMLLEVPDLELVIITSSKIAEKYAGRYPTVEFRTWALADFVSALQTCDVSCLTHDGSIEDRAKGNNKMIASITYGVPAVLSRTPAYESTAREVGVEDALFSDEQELRMVIERLRSPEARRKYLDLAQPVIWKRYSPAVIAQQYIELASKCLQNRHRFFRVFRTSIW